MDMAVSMLSRLVILRELVPRLSSGARVFVYGMPGNGMKFRPDDLNAEKGYEPGFGYVHANTVGGNEAVVHHLAATAKEGGVTFYGMNPGLLSTGIRDTMHGGAGTCFGGYLESAWLCWPDSILMLFPSFQASSAAASALRRSTSTQRPSST